MTSYGQFCPVAVASEVLTERWTPVVLRELLCGSRRFNELRRGLPLMSPSLLSKRLKTLERVGVLERVTTGDGRGVEYHLTPAGEELRPIIEAIGAWGIRWVRGESVKPGNLDAAALMWDVRRGVRPDAFPVDRRVVVHFHLQGSPNRKSRFWLVVDRGDVDLCLTEPGFDVDVTVRAHVRTVVEAWLGERTIEDAMAAGDLELSGPRALLRAFPDWFAGSQLASVPRP